MVVRKRDKSLRLCCDYTALNAKFADDQYQMPNPSDILGKAVGAKYISMIDLKMAYYQIPVAKDSQKYVAFKSSLGLLTWTRMPFGVKDHAATGR